jgi:hypothetical protein
MRSAVISVAFLWLGLGSLTGTAADLPASGRSAPEPAALTPARGAYSASQLYNLANGYARSGQTALAVLSYERARVLAPSDADLRANLRRVREAAGLPTTDVSWLDRYGRFANPNAIYWLGIAGLVLSGGCWLLLRRKPKRRGGLRMGAVIGIALVAATLFNAAANVGVLSESVALHGAAATVSPVEGADALFEIPAAATVRVLDRHGAFELVRDSQGREGWVAATDLCAVILD